MNTFVDRHKAMISGCLSCFDRVVIHGTLPQVGYAQGMSHYLDERGMRIFEYPNYAATLRDSIRENAESLAKEAGCQIEFVRGARMRKEDRVREVMAERGQKPGLVHILSAMEGCTAYQPRYDKQSGRAFLKHTTGKCLHYYFYFMDAELGLCHLRVPTWCPFRLQFYFNGHNQLATKLTKAGIQFKMVDNAFIEVADVDKAQRLANSLSAEKLHKILDRYAAMCCPPAKTLGVSYHWSFMQAEYSTDILFRRADDLGPLYDTIARAAVIAVKAENVATFLGRKIHYKFNGEVGNDFCTRSRGTRIKHHMGSASIKMYDKVGRVLRIETTANDVSFFRHHRQVVQRDGTKVFKLAPLKKSIYSILDLRDIMMAANQRYIEFIASLADPNAGRRALSKVSMPATQAGRRYRGLNFFAPEDDQLLRAIARGEFTVSGMRNKDLQPHLPKKKPSWISRAIKRLRCLGLLKKTGRTYKYYLTELGRRVILTGLKLREMVIIPQLSVAANSCQDRA